LNPSIVLERKVEEKVIEKNVANIIEEDSSDDEECELAPKLLVLNDNEKFKDSNGKIIDIELRGEKHRNKIYFKVSDISKVFEMPNLNSTLHHSTNNYIKNIHYKCFKCVIGKSSTNLYLTYYGMLKVINVSRMRSNYFIENICILNKWLDYIINNKYFENYTLKSVKNDLTGAVYICSSPLIDAVKIGFWTGTVKSLQSRYNMVFGKDLFLTCKNVDNVRDIEREIHIHFNQYNISGELFKKEHLQLYIDYFNNNIIECERNMEDNTYSLNDEDDNDNTDAESEEDEKDIVEELPKLLLLNDNEKFKDLNGNSIEIETRGEKHRNKIYFKASDVGKAFKMDNIKDTILRSISGYNKIDDYKIFKTTVIACGNKNKTPLYLTYHGLLRVLFVSRNKNVKQFQDWAEDKLFTIQMGSKEEKIKLGTNILNISSKTYKAVFDTYASKFPCIYLLSLGKVGALRETFGIEKEMNDDSVVYKYGFTDDLSRRIGEHETKYGKLAGVTMKLSTFHIIDTKYTNEAEGEVREMCSAFEKKLNVEGYNEFIILNEKEHGQMKKMYKRIGNECAGATLELQTQISELKEKIKDLENNYKIELMEKDVLINNEKHKNEILQNKLDTNQIIHNLEKNNYILQIQILSK
jgi:hypothetical protein